MTWQQYLNSDKTKMVLLSGSALLLLAALVGVSIILQWQFNARIAQIENAALLNNQRLTNIESFLGQVQQELQTRQSAPTSTQPTQEVQP